MVDSLTNCGAYLSSDGRKTPRELLLKVQGHVLQALDQDSQVSPPPLDQSRFQRAGDKRRADCLTAQEPATSPQDWSEVRRRSRGSRLCYRRLGQRTPTASSTRITLRRPQPRGGFSPARGKLVGEQRQYAGRRPGLSTRPANNSRQGSYRRRGGRVGPLPDRRPVSPSELVPLLETCWRCRESHPAPVLSQRSCSACRRR